MEKSFSQEIMRCLPILFVAVFMMVTIYRRNTFIYEQFKKECIIAKSAMGVGIYKMIFYYPVKLFFLIIPVVSIMYILNVVKVLSLKCITDYSVIFICMIPYFLMGMASFIGITFKKR